MSPGDGRKAAGHILKWSSNQACIDPAAFTRAIVDMFRVEAQIDTPDGIELDKARLRRTFLTLDASLLTCPFLLLRCSI